MLGIIGFVEVGHYLCISLLAILDEVQGVFHLCSKADIENMGIMLYQQDVHIPSKFRGHKGTCLHSYITPVNDGGDGGGIGARPADTFVFKLLYEAGFGITWGRLSEMLCLIDLL